MTGTYTFLLTDIEGSTALARRLRGEWGTVLAEHHRVLRTAFEAAGGEGIGTQGDAFFVAFRSPRDAVAAAIGGQRALAGCDWPDGAELRVRMGIHTGEATIADGEFQGLAIHRAARICAAGRGGQVLLSQATQVLLEDEDLQLVDLGERQLKDFERPVRIHELVVPPEEGADRPAEGADVIRVLIVDDQALVRAGFRMILDADDSIEVAGEAADGREAVAEARRVRPNVVLMDVRMPEMDGIEATRVLLREDGTDTRVVMLTTFDMDEYVYQALRAGASGFLLKDVPPEQLVEGIRAVASGDALLAPSITRRVIEEFVSRPPGAAITPPPVVDELTPREREVLTLMARGRSNAEIAEALVVSETTVKTHVAHVLMKLGVRDRVQAVVFAYESGLVEPGEG